MFALNPTPQDDDGRLMLAGKDPSPVFEPSQEDFGQFLESLHGVAQDLAGLNVLEDDARSVTWLF